MESVEYKEVPLENIIVGPYNLRGENADKSPSLQHLKDSIWEDGLLHPPGVIENSDGTYTLVYGHRRYWAIVEYLKESFPTLPVRIIPKAQANELTAIRLAIAENIFRKSIAPIELAKKLLVLRNAGFNNREIAAEMGSESEGTVTDVIKLLSLEPEVQDRLMNGSLSMGHGKALLKLLRYPPLQGAALQQLGSLTKKARTVRNLEGIITALLSGEDTVTEEAGASIPPQQDTAHPQDVTSDYQEEGTVEADGGVVTCRYCEHQLTLSHLSNGTQQLIPQAIHPPENQMALPGLYS
jgi:ParB family transcriptional regulator, chromosome partitioning protein